MKINILGPLEIASPSRPPDLRRAKEQSLLAVFAMSAGETLTIATLVHRVWDDGTPSDMTVRTLRSYLSHVRDVVASAAGEARLETTPGGYRLVLDREHIDLHRFRRLRGQANALADSGETGHAASLLRQAEDLWRGPALAGLPGQWIEGMRRSLEEERQAARKRRIGLELELGRHLEVMGELQLLATEFPLDDQWLSYQMLALYRSGRQAEAIGLYIEGRRRFAEEGMDLNPGLVALAERMLRHDPGLEIAPARRRALPPRAESLPDRLPGFVGRTAELASVTGVNQPPTWIIGGVGGVGKTALAVEVAHRVRDRYPDPPLYLNFHAHVPGQVTLDAAGALRNLLDMLGIPQGRQSRSVRELIALWQRQVATRRSVIILDDVPGGREISAILPRAGECLTLVTTRRRMTAMPNSALLSLEVMPEDDAVRLFSQTAGIEKADDPTAVIKAVRLCSCLPLAITVIGGRLRDGGPTIPEWVADIAAMRAFPAGFGDLSPRLVAAFEPPYEGLDNAHKEFFRRLSMNPCPDFTAGTAAVVVGVGLQEAQAALAALHDRHLVERGSADRFKFHDLVRWYAQFVAERDDSGWERRAAEHRLLDHYLQAVRRAGALLYPSQRYATVGEESAGAMQPGVATREDAQRWLELEWRNILSLAGDAGKHEWKRYCR